MDGSNKHKALIQETTVRVPCCTVSLSRYNPLLVNVLCSRQVTFLLHKHSNFKLIHDVFFLNLTKWFCCLNLSKGFCLIQNVKHVFSAKDKVTQRGLTKHQFGTSWDENALQ